MISRQTSKSLVIFNCDLCTEIAKFLTGSEQRILACVNKSLREPSKTFKYVMLCQDNAVRFVNDSEFREQILALVHYPNKQLAIFIRNVSDINQSVLKLLDLEITDVSALGSVHKLELTGLNGITVVSALRSVHTLDLFNCVNIRDVSALGGVHTLKLSILNDEITDVSALGRVHTLHIWHVYMR
jgi:hypothetical protein